MSWWKTQLEAIKGNALWDLVKACIASVFLALGGTQLLNQSVAKVPWVVLSLIGLYIFVTAFGRRHAGVKNAMTEPLAAGLMKADCQFLLQNYKSLDFDHREEVRLPRNLSSWPHFDQPWTYVHASLYTNATVFNLFLVKAHALWVHKGRTDQPPLFELTDGAKMYQVIEALEDFNRRLDEMVAAQTKPSR